jgi:hypothetical protein
MTTYNNNNGYGNNYRSANTNNGERSQLQYLKDGGVWKRIAKNGREYLVIVINGETYYAFQNDTKEKETHKDYSLAYAGPSKAFNKNNNTQGQYQAKSNNYNNSNYNANKYNNNNNWKQQSNNNGGYQQQANSFSENGFNKSYNRSNYANNSNSYKNNYSNNSYGNANATSNTYNGYSNNASSGENIQNNQETTNNYQDYQATAMNEYTNNNKMAEEQLDDIPEF